MGLLLKCQGFRAEASDAEKVQVLLGTVKWQGGRGPADPLTTQGRAVRAIEVEMKGLFPCARRTRQWAHVHQAVPNGQGPPLAG